MKKKKLYDTADILRAKMAMVDHLKQINGGELLRGCCTQGCCDEDELFGNTLFASMNRKYSEEDLLTAKGKMISTLADIAGGVIIAGCCTQGCCDDEALAAFINVP